MPHSIIPTASRSEPQNRWLRMEIVRSVGSVDIARFLSAPRPIPGFTQPHVLWVRGPSSLGIQPTDRLYLMLRRKMRELSSTPPYALKAWCFFWNGEVDPVKQRDCTLCNRILEM
jgi:hypothetical protein